MSATSTGSRTISRKFLSTSSSPIATHVPTHALRPNVMASATTSAGITSAGHIRSRFANTSRAAADAMTSIRMPEYVM
jgi:hypothetical protein